MHANGQAFRGQLVVETAGGTVYIEANNSGPSFCWYLVGMLRAVNADPATVRIVLE
jgi:hypothetical protein